MRELHINPDLLKYFKKFPLFVQYDRGTGTVAGKLFGFKVINNSKVERFEWRTSK